MKTPEPAAATPVVAAPVGKPRLPLRGWSLELARRWNGGTYSLFVLHGNIFDLFPVQDGAGVGFVPLKRFSPAVCSPTGSACCFTTSPTA